LWIPKSWGSYLCICYLSWKLVRGREAGLLKEGEDLDTAALSQQEEEYTNSAWMIWYDTQCWSTQAGPAGISSKWDTGGGSKTDFSLEHH
jgi:hypothetical protein